ncbi:uncharacterized protein LOC107809947 [Nicotiana tabacum]|uniref:RNA-directed DNA polymerase n=1 Tax=Nicotiana tabacum TaxID=4097 RepID=A0A1S4BML8_TOBAC|nr:PREDICTED: uncharacterized protein LOC107809947 [Nicotiana tabacum]
MTRSSTKELANYDPETEKSLRLRRKGQTSSPQGIACEEMENEELNNNHFPPYQWSSDRMIVKKVAGVNQVEAWNSLAQQIATLTQKVQAFQQSLEDKMYKFIKATDKKVESQNSAIKNLEIQMSQLATLMSRQIKGDLPSNTKKNPKEHLKAIFLRSGKTLDDPYADRQRKPQEVEQVNKGENKRDSELLKEQKDKGKKVQENELMTNPHFVPLPFPQKLKREKLDKQFSTFLEILKHLYINIPFTDALNQIPAYAKFLKEILSSNRKLEEVSVFKFTEKFSAILQNKLPQKLGDPSSFTIHCTLGGAHFEKALCDSGASINLMPFSIFRKLELSEMKDIVVSLQLADQKQERKLIEVLREHKRALGWTIADIKEISPAIFTHRILMEDNYKTIVQPHRRLNPTMQEVVKKEVVKLLAAGIIYLIYVSPWIPIAPEDQEKTTFTCPQAMTEKFLEIFMDDFILFGKTFEDCLYHLTLVLKICEETNLVLSWEKYHFMVTEEFVLGHKITVNGIKVDKDKIDLITGLPPPTTIKDDCKKAFEILKKQLNNAPIVVSPDWSQPFEIMCDASDLEVGEPLEQTRDKIFRPIYYASRTLNEARKNYATTEKDLLAVVFAFDKFRSYLIGTKVTVFTDHGDLKYLLANKDPRPRLLRWILLLQEFDLEIKDRRGLENQVDDHLSCLENPPTETTYIKEEFPDEHVYTIATVTNHTPWFDDIANYLVGGWIPKDFSYEQRKKLKKRNKPLS